MTDPLKFVEANPVVTLGIVGAGAWALYSVNGIANSPTIPILAGAALLVLFFL
jgi:hypothetical protein